MTEPQQALTPVTASDALAAVADAESEIRGNDQNFRARTQYHLALVVLAVWALIVVADLWWTLHTSEGTGKFVCNTPPQSAGAPGTDCTNGWVATRDALKDLFTTAVLPFLTLVLGFYFGQQSKNDEPQ